MFNVLVLLSLFLEANSQLTIVKHEPPNNLSICVHQIIEKYFLKDKTLSFFNTNDDDDSLLKVLHALEISVTIRKLDNPLEKHNKAYFIVTGDHEAFTKMLSLKRDKYWNPYGRFLIVIKHLRATDLRRIFDVLLKLRVYNVIVANGTETAELYTYDPFINSACGNYYTEVIELGKYYQVSTNIYPKKAKSLRNCSFRIAAPNNPPFSVGMVDNYVNYEYHSLGVEQYVFHLISEAEHFQYNHTLNYDPEIFSIVSPNMSVKGPMSLLENNDTDVMMGGMFLVSIRIYKFSYLHGHLDYEDRIVVLVKKATTKPTWKNFYLEFKTSVWLLLFLFGISYAVLLILVLRPKDKGHIVMTLLDNLVQHSTKFTFGTKRESFTRKFLIIWVVFAYLVNCYYTSSLVSLTTKPCLEPQIQNEEDLVKYGLKPCLSPVVVGYRYNQLVSEGLRAPIQPVKGCYNVSQSLHKVSELSNYYTVAPYFTYIFKDYEYKNEYGEPLIYTFKEAQNKIIYSSFINKGCPFMETFKLWNLRIKESGIISKKINDMYFDISIKEHFKFKEFKSRFFIPWWIYAAGILASFVTFLMELATYVRPT